MNWGEIIKNMFSQNEILKRLKNDEAIVLDYSLADNITRARYADHIWGDKSVMFRAHFMFHTSKVFNGFTDGHKVVGESRHELDFLHCCYCTPDKYGPLREKCYLELSQQNHE